MASAPTAARFFNTPWEREFLSHFHKAERIIRIACPFVKLRNVRLILASLPERSAPIRIELLTRLNISDCRSRVHDLSAMQLLFSNPIAVRCSIDLRVNNSLHAKLYIFDDSECIITSSNLTYSAFYRNLEVAISTSEQAIVQASTDYFNTIFSQSSPLTSDMLLDVQRLLEAFASPPAEIAAGVVPASELEAQDIAREATDTLDAESIAKVDEAIDSALDRDLRRSAMTLECQFDAPCGEQPATEQKFIEDCQQRFLAVFGVPVPDSAEVLTIFAHASTTKLLKSSTPHSGTAGVLELLGLTAFHAATTEVLVRSRPNAAANAIQTTESFISSSDHIIRQIQNAGLGRMLIGSSVDQSGIRHVARQVTFRLLGYLFRSRPWAEFRDALARLMNIEEEFPFESYRDHLYKGVLQQVAQEKGLGNPEYLMTERTGPDHAAMFQVEVRVGQRVIGSGAGTRKQAAEYAAAYNALGNLGTSAGLYRTSNARNIEVPRFVRELCASEGPTVIKRVCARTLSSDLAEAVLIPTGAFGTPPRRDVLRQLGGTVRSLLAASAAARGNSDRSQITQRVSTVNSNSHISQVLDQTPVGQWLRILSKVKGFEEVDGARGRVETVNAMLGALLLEHGLAGCETVASVLFREIDQPEHEDALRPKARLLHAIQAVLKCQVQSVLCFHSKPLHAPHEAHKARFLVVVKLDGREIGQATAGRVKDGEDLAAAAALANPEFPVLLDTLVAKHRSGDAVPPAAAEHGTSNKGPN